MNNATKLSIIITVGVAFSLLLAFGSGVLYKTQFSDYKDDPTVYNTTAISIAERGSLIVNNDTEFPRRPLGYSLLLAAAYFIWPSPISAFILQEVIFVLSIILIYLIASHFFERKKALVVTILFSLSWFISVFVIAIGSDLLAMMLALAFVYLWIKKKIIYTAIILGFLILTKPIMLYFIPIGLLALLVTFKKNRIKTAIVFTIVTLAVLAPFIMWSIETYGTSKMTYAGHILLRRAVETQWTYSDMGIVTLASLAGDLTAEQLSPGYVERPAAFSQVHEPDRTKELRAAGVKEKAMDEILYSEAISILKEHPIKFVITGAINLIRVNNPVNHYGIPVFQLLAREDSVSLYVRIAINIAVRLVWFFFLGIVIYTMIRFTKNNTRKIYSILPIILLLIFVQGIHAMFVHPEPRYLLPIMPFYLLFFTEWLWLVFPKKHIKSDS